MKVTTQYGLVAVCYIAKQGGIVRAQDIKMPKLEFGEVSIEYLHKVLQALVRGRVLDSKRGPRGGFTLARPPSETTLLDVVEAVEGEMRSDCPLVNEKVQEAMEEITNRVRGYLMLTPISHMI